jgi:hypothetical protein
MLNKVDMAFLDFHWEGRDRLFTRAWRAAGGKYKK